MSKGILNLNIESLTLVSSEEDIYGVTSTGCCNGNHTKFHNK